MGISRSIIKSSIAVSTPLHIEAVEAKIVSLRGGCIVIAHPLHQILYFFGAIDVLPLEVAVHHDDGGSVPVNVADNDGHGGQPRQLTGVFAAVACDQFIAAVLPWPRQRGDGDAVFLDAFGGFLHGRILPHLKDLLIKVK